MKNKTILKETLNNQSINLSETMDKNNEINNHGNR